MLPLKELYPYRPSSQALLRPSSKKASTLLHPTKPLQSKYSEDPMVITPSEIVVVLTSLVATSAFVGLGKLWHAYATIPAKSRNPDSATTTSRFGSRFMVQWRV